MANGSKQNKTKKNTNKEAFIWTDDEVQQTRPPCLVDLDFGFSIIQNSNYLCRG